VQHTAEGPGCAKPPGHRSAGSRRHRPRNPTRAVVGPGSTPFASAQTHGPRSASEAWGACRPPAARLRFRRRLLRARPRRRHWRLKARIAGSSGARGAPRSRRPGGLLGDQLGQRIAEEWALECSGGAPLTTFLPSSLPLPPTPLHAAAAGNRRPAVIAHDTSALGSCSKVPSHGATHPREPRKQSPLSSPYKAW
jgi:hypothetical protein